MKELHPDQGGDLEKAAELAEDMDAHRAFGRELVRRNEAPEAEREAQRVHNERCHRLRLQRMLIEEERQEAQEAKEQQEAERREFMARSARDNEARCSVG